MVTCQGGGGGDPPLVRACPGASVRLLQAGGKAVAPCGATECSAPRALGFPTCRWAAERAAAGSAFLPTRRFALSETSPEVSLPALREPPGPQPQREEAASRRWTPAARPGPGGARPPGFRVAQGGSGPAAAAARLLTKTP